ncbi:MAG: phosphoserine phosphatase SerB [Chromatiales bacterium]|nr:phosphoserine phosphatase SerB [Gammaproteobacteria bacterium]MCP5353367.1 phosphoserine phosphatase SerB [Chromatiales bacterium]
MSEVILIQVSGIDRPGITVALTEVLAQYGIDVLDIGQSVIHDTLSLGLLVEVPTEATTCPMFRDLLFRAHELDLNIRFNPVSDADYEHWVAEQGRHKHIVTLLGRAIRAEHIARVSAIVAGHGLNIDQISRLSGRVSRRADADPARQKACIQMTLSGPVDDLPTLHADFLRLGQALDVDIAFQEDDIYRRNRRLVCFDMDSTLIQCEVIDELAVEAGVGEQVAAITESAMRGELDFKESFRRRLALLEGMPESVLAKVAERLPITDGAERLICNLRKLGYKVAILSGGFTYFAEHLQRRFGIDYVHANQLDFVDGRLTGKIKGEVVDGARKAALLREIAAREGVKLEQVIAVGDGANDLPMLSIAGLGIAFHAKPIVKEQARHSIATIGLDGVLYLLGMRDWEVDKLQAGK